METYTVLSVTAWTLFCLAVINAAVSIVWYAVDEWSYHRFMVRARKTGVPARTDIHVYTAWAMLFALLCYDKF